MAKCGKKASGGSVSKKIIAEANSTTNKTNNPLPGGLAGKGKGK